MEQPAWIAESAVAKLKQLRDRQPVAEHCELCVLPLESHHAHLLEPKERRILCSCDPCAFLFQDGAGRYRRIPRDSFLLSAFELPELLWESLSVPISLAFFFYSSTTRRVVGFYPSPGGATESLLELSAWDEIAGVHPRLRNMSPDVEAFLVNRLATPPEYFVVPIDRAYELSGLVRKHWRGFTGGDAVWREIQGFFATLRSQAIEIGANRA
jgi:hypothetical protein